VVATPELEGVAVSQIHRKRGPEPLAAKRDQYLLLTAQGMNNSAACRQVGVNRKTGNRWRYGRTSVDRAGRTYTYPPITEQPQGISPRFLSEDERMVIADLLRAGNSTRAIARQLGRDPATISREVRRNRDARTDVYHPHRAQQRAVARRARVDVAGRHVPQRIHHLLRTAPAGCVPFDRASSWSWGARPRLLRGRRRGKARPAARHRRRRQPPGRRRTRAASQVRSRRTCR
jgi:transposase